MKRKVIAFGNYYNEFIQTLNDKEVLKLKYILSLLETTDRMPIKFRFQKKTQTTPENEIKQALKIKEAYYEYKQTHDNRYK
jgi:phage-related protein